jgi:hypothetical protein
VASNLVNRHPRQLLGPGAVAVKNPFLAIYDVTGFWILKPIVYLADDVCLVNV